MKLNAYVTDAWTTASWLCKFSNFGSEIGLAITVGVFLALLIGLGSTIWFLPALGIDVAVFLVAALVWAGADVKLLRNSFKERTLSSRCF